MVPRLPSPRCVPTLISTGQIHFPQTDYYDAWAPPNNGYVGHFPARDEKVHAERRRIVNNAYSMSSVLESEQAVDTCTQILCKTIREFANQKSQVDLGLWINM